jgi:general L-amino acid transport system permease protein
MMSASGFTAEDHQPIPFYRNVNTLKIVLQGVFVALVSLLFWWLIGNMLTALRRSNIPLGFDFLSLTAGFAIADTAVPYQATDTYARAFLVGIVNTLRVCAIGIVVATILGVVIGIGRLSSNWLLRSLASAYVEVIRNTPLAVQLIFWFVAVILKLPRVREAVGIDGVVYLSNRGLTLAWPAATASFGAWAPWLWAGLAVGVGAFALRRALLRRADRPGSAWPLGLLAAGVTVLAGFLATWAITGASPLVIDRPVLGGFNFSGGVTISAAFFALLLGLTIYTAAFIAEVVRAGIQSVSKGQREASQALGLSPGQTMRLVVFPQALRVIVPPLTNQYLNLTKNSSLGILVAFPDLFFVATTVNNQSGRAVQVVAIVMGCYLLVSLLTSLVTNLYNRRIRLVER